MIRKSTAESYKLIERKPHLAAAFGYPSKIEENF